ncbi:MAG TPA: lysylphosphatidylglycerol synthase transmembrane domain-containing protein [Anaerolineales bacterium]|nr:lysylphosphatidylglycerol synthase transmembrane domain-containing protein [Anaerolineales bacterium]
MFGDDVRRWQLWLGLAISVAFLALAARNLHWPEVAQALRQADYPWLIPGVAVYLVGVLVRSWRWHYLLRPIKDVPSSKLFPVMAIGYFGNNVFPIRAGELLRIYLLKLFFAIPMSAGLATILVERAFDGIVMLGFVFLNLPRLSNLSTNPQVSATLRALAVGGAVVFLGATLVLIILALFPERSAALAQVGIDRVLPGRMRPRARQLFDQFLVGLGALRSPVDVLMILGTSILIWLLETLKYWFVMHAFPFQVSFFVLMLMNGIVNLATTLPSAPGYLGTFDAPGIAVLEGSGVSAALAAGYTFVLHAALWLPITLLGGYYLLRTGLSLRTIQSEARREQRG